MMKHYFPLILVACLAGAGCNTTSPSPTPRDKVELSLQFENSQIVVGKLCKVTLSLANRTPEPVWCSVPGMTDFDGPAGFQPNGMHISPMRRLVPLDGLACSLEFAGKMPAHKGGMIRGVSTTAWAKLDPGQIRSTVVYFDGNTLRTPEHKQPVWETMGRYVVTVSTDYRTEHDDDTTQRRIVSPPVEITVVKK